MVAQTRGSPEHSQGPPRGGAAGTEHDADLYLKATPGRPSAVGQAGRRAERYLWLAKPASRGVRGATSPPPAGAAAGLSRYILTAEPAPPDRTLRERDMANIETPDEPSPEPRKLEDFIGSQLNGFEPAPPAPTKTAPPRQSAPSRGDGINMRFGEPFGGSDEPPGDSASPPLYPDPDAPFAGAVDVPDKTYPSSRTPLPSGPSPEPTGAASAPSHNEEEEEEEEEEDDGPPTQDGDLDGSAPAEPANVPSNPPVDEPEVDQSARIQVGQSFSGAYRVEGSTYVTLTSAANDDPWADDVSDQLGVLPDAKAFARLVVSKQFFPPLAVGVFGPWGSGKSFFMRLVHDHIERLKVGQPSHAAPEADTEAFFNNVVQIRFNAWHYVETNLWASLVDHLFTRLAVHLDGDKEETRILDQLGTARELTIEAAEELVATRADHKRAGEVLAAAREDFSKAERKVKTEPQLYLNSLKTALVESKEGKALIDDAARTLGLPEFNANADKVDASWRALDNELRSGSVVIGGMAKLFGNYRWLVAVLLLGLPFAAIWLVNLGRPYLPILQIASPSIAAASAMLAAAAGLLGKGAQVVKGAVEQLRKGMAVIDKKAAELTATERAAVEVAAADLEKARIKVDEAQSKYQVTSARLAAATEEFYSSSGSERLIKLIRKRATDGHYASHLGLVASVRRDLEELSRGLEGPKAVEAASDVRVREAQAARVAKLAETLGEGSKEILGLRESLEPKVANPPPFDRLVLYIDDLDRCPADKVVEVLQAVHMLLAFKLFVVFVAVDVRWVSHALRTSHPGLLSGASEGGSQATPRDYLEKIFQVPYWVRSATGGSQNLIASLLPHLPPPSAPKPAAPTPASPQAVTAVGRQALEVTIEERKLFERIAPYVASSPRKVVWFINVYRIIKANDEYASELVADEGARMALITQLALVSRSPGDFNEWFQYLTQCTPGSGANDLFWDGETEDGLFATNPRKTQLLDLLHAGFQQLHFKGVEPVPLVTLLKYGELAQRYSFALPAHEASEA